MFGLEKNKQEKIIRSFTDLRGVDLSTKNLKYVSVDVLVTTDFDTETIWPTKEKLPENFNPEKILENGKDPGLGIHNLHEQGIDGRDVTVAIIDQKLDVNHPEYKTSLINYTEYAGAKEEEISMHGPAVVSLLVGKKCGIVPGAKLVYKALPAGRNFILQAQALNDLIEYNKNKPPKEKIRVVSCSIGCSQKNEPGLNAWFDALRMAREEGLIVIDVNGKQIDLEFTGGGNANNKENIDEYKEWLYTRELKAEMREKNKDLLIVPSDYRTMASSWREKNQYMYNGQGGMSWSVPYLTGIFALALQINPDIRQEEIVEIINKTAVSNKRGLKIINPKGIIELVIKTKK